MRIHILVGWGECEFTSLSGGGEEAVRRSERRYAAEWTAAAGRSKVSGRHRPKPPTNLSKGSLRDPCGDTGQPREMKAPPPSLVGGLSSTCLALWLTAARPEEEQGKTWGRQGETGATVISIL